MSNNDNDSKAIEDKAVNEVNCFFEDSKVVSAFLQKNDREPFFDGHLYLYHSGKRDTIHYTGRVAVQIKGKILDEFTDGYYSYSVEMTDLKAYLPRGIAYFVVQEVKKSKRLFYRLLAPIELRTIINKKPDNNTVSIRLKRAKKRDMKKIETELLQFDRDCQKQTSFAYSNPLDLSELMGKGINSFTFDITCERNSVFPLLDLTAEPIFVYANYDESIQIPVGTGKASVILVKDVFENVSIKGKVYYDHYESRIEKGCFVANVGGSFTLLIQPDKKKNSQATMNVKCCAKKLKDVLREAEFILALQKEKEITIGNQTYPIPFPDENELTKVLEKNLKAWHELDDMLNILGCSMDLDMSQITKRDGRTIDILIDMIIKGTPHILKNVKSCVNNVQIANLHLWLVIFQDKEGNHIVKNLFDKSLGLKAYHDYPEGRLEESVCSCFNRNALLNCDNFPFKEIIHSYESLKNVNPHIYEQGNLFLLELIAAYDLTNEEDRKKVLYQAATTVSDWLLQKDAEEYKVQNQLNRFQLLKREPGLTKEDRKTLKHMQFENAGNVEVAYAIALLLDDKTSYEYYWNKMSKEIQDLYRDCYPIFKFHNE